MPSPKAHSVQTSDYELTFQVPFNQPNYYPLKQTISPDLYQPTGTWVGRLLLPTPEQLATVSSPERDWVWLEVVRAPEVAENLVGQVVRLTWEPKPSLLAYVNLVTTPVQFTQKAENSQAQGNVVPTRLNGRDRVGPLQSLAGARPHNDVLISFEQAKSAIDETGKPLLLIEQFPTIVPERFYTLVDIVETVPEPTGSTRPTTCPGQLPCQGEFFRIRHYNRVSRKFDGLAEIVRIPQQPPLSSGRFGSTPRQLEESPVGQEGWYLYGAQGPDGIFTVRAIQPRSLLQLNTTERIGGKRAALTYLEDRNWQNTPARKGTAQTVLVVPSATSPQTTQIQWQEGERALLIHLFGGIGGEKGESLLAATVTGHFAFGLVRVVRDPFTNELRFDIEYQQVYAHNSQGILSGTQAWANYMGHLQRGWLGSRPVSDVIVNLDVLNDYNFDGIVLSPLDELELQLQVMMARYRTGDGTGNSRVSPATSCVQDSNQALYIALEQLKRQVRENPTLTTWLKDHPNHPQTERFERLVSLVKALKEKLSPQGVVRPDWQQNAETLAGVKRRDRLAFIENDSLNSAWLSWRFVLPRSGYDTLARIFLAHKAQLWFIRTNQVGGWDSDIVPLAPTLLFGDIPIISLVLRRVLISVISLPEGQDWLIGGGILFVYAALALPIGFFSGFLHWHPQTERGRRLLMGSIIAFFSPALLEELVFRAIWLPHPTEDISPSAWLFWGVSGLLLFILYHPLNAATFYRQGNPTFFHPIFLSLTGLLGLACTLAYALTGSLWIVVVIHWLVVTIWLFGFGGETKLYPAKLSNPK